jgi:hypothetical protein
LIAFLACEWVDFLFLEPIEKPIEEPTEELFHFQNPLLLFLCHSDDFDSHDNEDQWGEQDASDKQEQ